MKKLIALLLFMPSLTFLHSQEIGTKQTIELPTNFHERLEFSGAYYGNNLWNPGLKFGAEYLWTEKQKIKKRSKNRTKTITKQKILAGDVGFYWHPRNHVGAFATFGVTFRRTSSKKNRQFSVKINPLGYYRSFLPETYEVTDGGVDKVVLPGRSYFAPSISIGTGKLRDGKTLKAHFINLNLMFLDQYNTNINPLISIDFGYRFNGKKRNKITAQKF